MKKRGILNSCIAKILCDLGHTDQIVIADAGLPVPEGVSKIDLALKPGAPCLKEVLDVVMADLIAEKVIIAYEADEKNQEFVNNIKEYFTEDVIERVSHEEFKMLTQRAKVIIRTGEVMPFANCILQSGVFF